MTSDKINLPEIHQFDQTVYESTLYDDKFGDKNAASIRHLFSTKLKDNKVRFWESGLRTYKVDKIIEKEKEIKLEILKDKTELFNKLKSVNKIYSTLPLK